MCPLDERQRGGDVLLPLPSLGVPAAHPLQISSPGSAGMDDRLLEVYELAALGDTAAARAMLASLGEVPAEQRAEMEAFLDASESNGPIEDVDALESTLAGPTQLAGPGARQEVRPDVVPFRCLHCGGEVHTTGRALLNTALFTFLGWDAVEETARVVMCAACGHCAWFVHAMPGALQAMASPDDSRRSIQGEGEAPCRVCGFRGVREGTARLHSRGLTFLGLEWLNEGARTESCLRCGHIRWSRRSSRPWGQPADHRVGACMACGGEDVSEQEALLNSPLMTHLGLDWLDGGARLRSCRCGGLDWFVRPLPAASSK